MTQNLTALPMDSEEGVVLELRYGNRFQVKCDTAERGFIGVMRNGKVRVTAPYAKMLQAEHGTQHPQLGWVSLFVEEGTTRMDESDKVQQLLVQAAEAREDADLAAVAKAEAEENEAATANELADANLELAQLKTKLEALERNEPATATEAPAAVEAKADTKAETTDKSEPAPTQKTAHRARKAK